MKIIKILKSLVIAVTFFVIVIFIRGVIAINNADTSIAATPQLMPQTARLSFQPEQIFVKPSESFQVAVNLSTGDQAIVGTDIAIMFDNTNLELQAISPIKHSVLKTFVPLTVDKKFDSDALVQQANSTGNINFGTVIFDAKENKRTNDFVGQIDSLVTLTFQTKATAQNIIQPIAFYYTEAGATVDSNVVAISAEKFVQDILLHPVSEVIIVFKE